MMTYFASKISSQSHYAAMEPKIIWCAGNLPLCGSLVNMQLDAIITKFPKNIRLGELVLTYNHGKLSPNIDGMR